VSKWRGWTEPNSVALAMASRINLAARAAYEVTVEPVPWLELPARSREHWRLVARAVMESVDVEI
jgi:hypothetical protein